MFKGLFILALGAGIVINVIAKVQSGIPPSSTVMLTFGGMALAANLICLRLLWRYRGPDVNMAGTFECSRNDVISNVGVLVAAGAVALLHSHGRTSSLALPWPVLFLRSSLRVIADAGPKLRAA